MPYRAHWIVLLVALAAWSVSGCDVQSAEADGATAPVRGPADVQQARTPQRPGMAESGLDPIGDAPDRPAWVRADGVTVVVDVPEPYAPPGCNDDASAAGGRV